MTYQYAKMGKPQFKDYVHGSGSIDNETLLAYSDLNRIAHKSIPTRMISTSPASSSRRTNAMVYAPMSIAVGTGYYAANPVAYDSLLKEKTWVKNLRSGTRCTRR